MAPSTRFFQNQNRTIILSIKKAVVYTYIFYKKNMVLRNSAKWNLRKDYKYNILKNKYKLLKKLKYLIKK